MSHTENMLKDLEKKNLIALVLNFQNDREKLMEKFCEHLCTLCNTVDNLSSKLDLGELYRKKKFDLDLILPLE